MKGRLITITLIGLVLAVGCRSAITTDRTTSDMPRSLGPSQALSPVTKNADLPAMTSPPVAAHTTVPVAQPAVLVPTSMPETQPPPSPTPVLPGQCAEPYFFTMPSGWEARDLCPDGPPTASRMAEQVFERGRMLWVEKQNLIFAIYGNGNWQTPPGEDYANYSITIDTWKEGDPESDPNLTPPSGLYQPVRGFGKVWRENSWLREKLGWAVTPEQGYDSVYQSSQQSPDWMLNTYDYYQLLDGRIAALMHYRRGWHWGFVQ